MSHLIKTVGLLYKSAQSSLRCFCLAVLKCEYSQLIHLLPTMVFKKASEHDKGVSEEDDKVREGVMLKRGHNRSFPSGGFIEISYL